MPSFGDLDDTKGLFIGLRQNSNVVSCDRGAEIPGGAQRQDPAAPLFVNLEDSQGKFIGIEQNGNVVRYEGVVQRPGGAQRQETAPLFVGLIQKDNKVSAVRTNAADGNVAVVQSKNEVTVGSISGKIQTDHSQRLTQDFTGTSAKFFFRKIIFIFLIL